MLAYVLVNHYNGFAMYSWLESNQASRMGGGILVAGHESVEWCYCDLVCQWWCTHCIKIKAANQGCSKSERRSATGANKTWCHQLRIRMKYLEVYSSNSSNTDARELILSNDTSVVSLSGIKTMLIVTMWWCFFCKGKSLGTSDMCSSANISILSLKFVSKFPSQRGPKLHLV